MVMSDTAARGASPAFPEQASSYVPAAPAQTLSSAFSAAPESGAGASGDARVSGAGQGDGAVVPRGTSAASPSSPEEVQAALGKLLDAMKPQRQVILEVLKFCRESRAAAEVSIKINELQESRRSVYDASAITAMLVKAGALEKEGEENEPERVEQDGVAYWKPVVGAPATLVSTPAALEVVMSDDPLGRAVEVLEHDAAYAAIYQRLLALCDVEGGASPSALNEAIDDDPLVQKPRRFALYFIDKMEQCACIVWDGMWKTTEIGRKLAEKLAESPEHAAESSEEPVAEPENLAAETA